jgi:hypothetical protein
MPIADGNDDTTFRNALTKVATADSRGTAFVVTGHSATRSPLTSDEAELLRQRFRRVIVFAIGDGEPNFRRTADYELLSAASADEILTLWTSAIAS